jgi:LPXTG-motif cell wall-anchored protein
MISVTLIRIIAGVLAVVILGIIIWRRKRRSIE